MIDYNDTDDYDDDKGAGQKMFGGFFSGKGGGGGRYWVPPDFLGIFLSLCPCGGNFFRDQSSRLSVKGEG